MSGFDNYDAWKTASPYDDPSYVGFERVCEWLESVFPDIPESVNYEWFIETVANGLGQQSQRLVNAVDSEAAEWARAERQKCRRT